MVRSIGSWMAHQCGLLVVTPEQLLEWTQYATEYNRLAGDYETSDEYLAGKNDGCSQSLLRCCQDVQNLNTEPPSSFTKPSELEEKILKEANDEFFKQPMSAGHRITSLQARCVIRAWLRNVMPHLLDEA